MQRLLSLRARQIANLRSPLLCSCSPARRTFHAAELHPAWVRRHPPTVQSVHEPAPRFYMVRFLNPIFTRRRVLRFILHASTFVVFWKVILPLAFLEEELDGEEQLLDKGADLASGSDEAKSEADPEDALFIPCTWPKKTPRTKYADTSPEKQAFLQFNRDTEKIESTKQVVARWARQQIQRMPEGRRLFGNIDSVRGKASLFIYYPSGPPQDYEMTGIGITADYIAWMGVRVTPKEYDQMCEKMFPVNTMKGYWAHLRFHFLERANLLRQNLGLEPWTDPEISRVKASMVKTRQNRSGAVTTADEANSSPGSGGATRDLWPENLGPINTVLVVHRLWSRSRGTRPPEPRRGSLIVKGYVDLVGEKRDGVVEVIVHFDPKENVVTNLFLELRELSSDKSRQHGRR